MANKESSGFQLILPGNTSLSTSEWNAVSGFAREVINHAPKAGQTYDRVVIVPRMTERQRGFTTSVENGLVVLRTNVDTLMDTRHINPQGIIGHEADHMVKDYIVESSKVEASRNAFSNLEKIADMFEATPIRDWEKAIKVNFGSTARFKVLMDSFTPSYEPALSEIAQFKQHIAFTPEAFARHMDAKDETNTALRKIFRMLPTHEEVMRFDNELSLPADKPAFLAYSIRPANRRQVVHDFQQFMHLARKADFANFLSAYALASEYSADVHGAKTASDPNSMLDILHWGVSETPKQLLLEDGDRHPSLTRRITRLTHCIYDGKPPADDQLREGSFTTRYRDEKSTRKPSIG